MPEIVSRQAANIAAGTKSTPAGVGSKKRTFILTSPATAAWAQNDTIATGSPIPIGTRFLCDSFASHTAFGLNVTLTVGLRDFKTKAVISATAIATAADISAAGRTALNTGAYVAAGVEYVTDVVTELYAVIGGAAPTANAQIRLEISAVTTD